MWMSECHTIYVFVFTDNIFITCIFSQNDCKPYYVYINETQILKLLLFHLGLKKSLKVKRFRGIRRITISALYK